jgi:hypothetical protein
MASTFFTTHLDAWSGVLGERCSLFVQVVLAIRTTFPFSATRPFERRWREWVLRNTGCTVHATSRRGAPRPGMRRMRAPGACA